MADSDNTNPMHKNEFINALINHLRSQFKAEKDKKEAKPQPQKGDEMVWFSMNENGTDFVSSADAPTHWAGQDSKTPAPKGETISPDLAIFLDRASSLLTVALYTPIKTRAGRLSDFFSVVEHGANILERESYSPFERKVYEDWCKIVGDNIDKAQVAHGLWLTDQEESLVGSMKTGIFGGVR